MSLTVAPQKVRASEFGKLSDRVFAISNNSSNVIVLGRVESSVVGNDPVALSGAVYGSIWKERDSDVYQYNPVSQQRSQLSFHSGLLMPGEEITILARHRPVSRRETFKIEYHKALRAYDGSPESMQPFRVYVHAEGSSGRYIPFSASEWKGIVAKYPTVSSVGSDASVRAVLIPGLAGQFRIWEASVNFDFEGSPFCLEDAATVASRISGAQIHGSRLVFCSAMAAYVVFDADGSWMLLSPEQDAKKGQLAAFPSGLLNDVDLGHKVEVKVGDKQEGFGPSLRRSLRVFWDRYPVYFGDGMYTRGEFLHLEKDQIVEFLRQAHSMGQFLSVHHYFFGSRYYVLRDLKPLPAAEVSPRVGE